MKIADRSNRAEIIRYLFFGVCTTAVGWIVYFAVLLFGKTVASIPTEDTSSGKYLLVYTIAQIIQWIAAVLFAFYTNKKWVFTEADKEESSSKQLLVFAGGRLLTFGLDYAVTYLGAIGLAALFPFASNFEMLGREWNLNEIAAKLVAAVLVIIGNYVFSKLLVFKNKKNDS